MSQQTSLSLGRVIFALRPPIAINAQNVQWFYETLVQSGISISAPKLTQGQSPTLLMAHLPSDFLEVRASAAQEGDASLLVIERSLNGQEFNDFAAKVVAVGNAFESLWHKNAWQVSERVVRLHYKVTLPHEVTFDKIDVAVRHGPLATSIKIFTEQDRIPRMRATGPLQVRDRYLSDTDIVIESLGEHSNIAIVRAEIVWTEAAEHGSGLDAEATLKWADAFISSTIIDPLLNG